MWYPEYIRKENVIYKWDDEARRYFIHATHKSTAKAKHMSRDLEKKQPKGEKYVSLVRRYETLVREHTQPTIDNWLTTKEALP